MEGCFVYLIRVATRVSFNIHPSQLLITTDSVRNASFIFDMAPRSKARRNLDAARAKAAATNRKHLQKVPELPRTEMAQSPMPPILSQNHWADGISESEEDVVAGLTDDDDEVDQPRLQNAFEKLLAEGRAVFGTSKEKNFLHHRNPRITKRGERKRRQRRQELEKHAHKHSTEITAFLFPADGNRQREPPETLMNEQQAKEEKMKEAFLSLRSYSTQRGPS